MTVTIADWLSDMLERYRDVLSPEVYDRLRQYGQDQDWRVVGIDLMVLLLDRGQLLAADRPAALEHARAGRFGKNSAWIAAQVARIDAA